MLTMFKTTPNTTTLNNNQYFQLDTLDRILHGINSYEKFDYIKPEIKEDSVIFKYKFAGYEKNEIKIDSENSHSPNRILKITGHNEEYGTIIYKSVIPTNVDDKSVKAVLKNGILTLSFLLEKLKSPLANIKIHVD